MNRELPIHHESLPLDFLGAVVRRNGLFKSPAIQALPANARGLLDELVMEAHLIAGAFRAARSYGGDPLGSKFPVIPGLWFRE
jgi:hypothetical protein